MFGFDRATKVSMVFWLLACIGLHVSKWPWTTWVSDPGAPAWVQAVGSVLAILAMVWQRHHEASAVNKARDERQMELQNGARRIVTAVSAVIADLGREELVTSISFIKTDWLILKSKLETLRGSLDQIDASELPSWRHTEAVVVASTSVACLLGELARMEQLSAANGGLWADEDARMKWVASFEKLVLSMEPQLNERVAVLAAGLPVVLDPA